MKRQYKPRSIHPPQHSYTDMLVTAHGETMGRTKTGAVIGVSRWTIYRYVDAGILATAADGKRILTRSVASFIESQGKK